MSRLRKVVLSMSPLSLIGYIWDSHYDRGMSHLANGRYEQAEAEFLTVAPNNRDHDSCQYALGMCRLYGLGGLKQDPKEGIQLLQKAAMAQYSPTIRNKARYLLGMYYAQAEKDSKQQIFPEDPNSVKDILEELKAHEEMRNKHNAGDSEITKAGLVSGTLAEIYLAGAAIKEYLPAQYELGVYYYNGNFRMTRHVNEAKRWLQEAVTHMTNIWSFKESCRLTPEQLENANSIIEGKPQNYLP